MYNFSIEGLLIGKAYYSATRDISGIIADANKIEKGIYAIKVKEQTMPYEIFWAKVKVSE